MVLQQSSSTYPRPPCCSNDEQWLLFKSGWYLHNPQIVWKFNSDKRLSLFQTAFKRIYTYGWFLTFLFLQSLHTISLEIYVEQSQVFVHYRLDENKRHSYIEGAFLTCNVSQESGFIQEMNYSIKVCTSLPSIFMTGVHPPSPHPKFPIWQKTDNGWESTTRVTTPLILDLFNQNIIKKQSI